jgi:hypothetical protein
MCRATFFQTTQATPPVEEVQHIVEVVSANHFNVFISIQIGFFEVNGGEFDENDDLSNDELQESDSDAEEWIEGYPDPDGVPVEAGDDTESDFEHPFFRVRRSYFSYGHDGEPVEAEDANTADGNHPFFRSQGDHSDSSSSDSTAHQ